MKVILKAEVDNLGLAGEVVDVADGYGRNYLIPRGLAMKATRGALKEAETITRARKAHEARTLGDAEKFRDVLELRTIRISVRVDERGTLYGSVGASEIQDALKDRGHDIERRRIDLPRPIKSIGEYVVPVRVHPQVTADLPVEVVDVEGAVTLESLEERAAEERASIEERALAAAAEVEAEEAEEAAEGSEDAEAAEVEATAEVEVGAAASDVSEASSERADPDDGAEPTETTGEGNSPEESAP